MTSTFARILLLALAVLLGAPLASPAVAGTTAQCWTQPDPVPLGTPPDGTRFTISAASLEPGMSYDVRVTQGQDVDRALAGTADDTGLLTVAAWTLAGGDPLQPGTARVHVNPGTPADGDPHAKNGEHGSESCRTTFEVVGGS